MSTIETESQSLVTGNRVTLYQLDATDLGGGVFYFTKRKGTSGNILFGGIEYIAMDIEATGFAWDGKGAFPKPVLRVNNVGGLLTSSIINYKDLVGATITRLRTFEQFLDGQPEADPNKFMTPDYFTIEQKTLANAIFIEWRLSSVIDATGMLLPGRQILRDVCSHRYRIWTGASFKDVDTPGSNVTCPYKGLNYFDENDRPTSPQNDMCSKRLTGCKRRFGENGELPTWAFPGVDRNFA